VNSHSTSLDIRYSTEHVPAPQRFEYWNDVILRHCIPSEGKPLADSGFDGELTVREVGLVDVCTLTSTLHHWERKSRHLRTGPDDDLWLGYFQGVRTIGGRKASLSSNDLVLYDAAQTFRFSIGGKTIISFEPRHLLAGKALSVAF
jgi:hypothetical protein